MKFHKTTKYYILANHSMKRNRNDRQILGSCQRTKKSVEYEGDGVGVLIMVSKEFEKSQMELEIKKE